MGYIKYTLGFIFVGDEVLLLKKNSPIFLKDKLNGLGGKLHHLEAPSIGMSRECKEESGVDVERFDWEYTATIQGDGYEIYCFCVDLDTKPELVESDEGTLHWVKWRELSEILAAPNVELICNIYRRFEGSNYVFYEKRVPYCPNCGIKLYDENFDFTCVSCMHVYCKDCMATLDEMTCKGCATEENDED